MNSKVDVFVPNVSDSEYNIIALSETWLKPEVNSCELFSGNYEVFRSDRKCSELGLATGGGVLLAIDEIIQSEAVDTSYFKEQFPAIDFLVCKCLVSFRLFYVAVIYIPPSLCLEGFENFFEALENFDVFCSQKVLFMGDFNCSNFIVNDLDDRKTRSITNFLAFVNMRQFNDVLNNHSKLLDLTVSNMNCTVTHDYFPLVNEDNYHPALSILINDLSFKQPTFVTNCKNKTYNYKKANYLSLYYAILNTNWNFLENIPDSNSAVDFFYSKFYEILDVHVPVYKNFSRKFPVWYSKEIINLIKEKHRLHRNFKKTNRFEYYQEFSRVRAQVKHKTNESYNIYLQNIQAQLKSDPKSFWTFINNKNKCSRIPGSMFGQGVSYNNPQTIVDAFSKFFEEVYSVPDPNGINPEIVVDHNTFIDISCEPVTDTEILAAGKKLKNKFTSGPDNIPSFLIKDCLIVLTNPLKTIFNLILKTSVFPDDWKAAKVCPIHKSNDKANIENYRPISILNNLAKLFETVLYNRIYQAAKNIISIHQHGFMNKRSTISNLAVFSQYLCEALDDKKQVDVAYTDFSKAFDKISHSILLHKLDSYGVSESYSRLIKSYLNQRTQYVFYNGFSSDVYFATSGVPQGSNLGPLLFLIYINDLCDSLETSRLMFADDLKIFAPISNLEDCTLLQNQLNLLQSWCLTNQLYLNISKCRIMTFTRKIKPFDFEYTINDITLERSLTVKDLGIHFDCRLSFNQHINFTVQTAYRAYGFIIRNCKNFTNIPTLRSLFSSLVRSKLEYGSIIWNPIYAQHSTAIEKVQKVFLKFLTYKVTGVYPPRGSNYGEMLHRFDFVSLEKRRKQASVLFLYKLIHSKVDCSDLLAKINFYVPRIASRHNNIFLCERAQTNLLTKAPINAMCSHANRLSGECDIFVCSLRELKAKLHLCM